MIGLFFIILFIVILFFVLIYYTAVILLLDSAVIPFVHAGYTNLDPIFQKVYLKATESDIVNKVFKHFSAPYHKYKDYDYVDFYIQNRLTVDQFF